MKTSFKQGFTLVELIVAISIIAVMIGSGALVYSNHLKNSRDARRKLDMLAIRSALELYRSNNTDGVYPVTNQLSALVPTYLESVPRDPKGVSYTYRSQSRTGSNCTSTPPTQYCVNYTLSITLESTGATYTLRPNSTP